MRNFFTIAILVLSINAFAQIPSYVPQNGLIGWWPFNGNAHDESGNGNHGTVNGATLSPDRFGTVNSTYSFNGNTNNIVIPSNQITSLNALTITCWFYANSNQTAYSDILQLDAHDNCTSALSNDSNCFIVRYWGGLGNFQSDLEITGTGHPIYATPVPSTSSWHYYTLIYDGQHVKAYLDNGLIGTDTCTGVFNSFSEPLYVGNWCTIEGFSGKIDDIGIWNRALTLQEISNMFNAGICYQTVTITDTLIINANLSGFNPITYKNTIKIYPNPTNDHITINFGSNYTTMSGYTLKITNTLGQTVFTTPINQAQTYINLSSWSGLGIYFVHLMNAQSNTIDIRKIVLQ